MNPPDIEAEILRLSARLEFETDRLPEYGIEAGNAEVNFKAAWAKALLGAEGTVDARKALADIESSALLLDRRRADVMFHACQETLRTIRAQLDALRTIAANVRVQV